MNNQAVAERIYAFMVDSIEIGHTIGELADHVGVNVGAVRKAMPAVRGMAESEGYFIPKAIGASGFKYVITDDVSRITAPTVEVGLAAQGMDDLHRNHLRQVEARKDQLTGRERVIMLGYIEHQKQVDEYHRNASRTTLEMLRDLERMERDEAAASKQGDVA